jgi:hypothetical protein
MLILRLEATCVALAASCILRQPRDKSGDVTTLLYGGRALIQELIAVSDLLKARIALSHDSCSTRRSLPSTTKQILRTPQLVY